MAFGRLLFPTLCITSLLGCAVPSRAVVAPVADSRRLPDSQCQHTIYLVRHGWHTGLALRTSEISTVDWPESMVFEDEDFIEVGWGDQAYLAARFPHPLILINAAFLPSRSAIHVAGIRGPVGKFFADSQIVAIRISSRQMRQLCRFIHESYRCDANGNPRLRSAALYGSGGIYSASGYYYVPNTCNVWTAKALSAADCPVVVPLCTFASPLVFQTKSFGDEVQPGSNLLPVIYPFVNFDRPDRY